MSDKTRPPATQPGDLNRSDTQNEASIGGYETRESWEADHEAASSTSDGDADLKAYAAAVLAASSQHIRHDLMKAAIERWPDRLEDLKELCRDGKANKCTRHGQQLPCREPGCANGDVPAVTAVSLRDCEAAFVKWLGDEYDLDILRGCVAAAAVNRLEGDPCWLLLVGGPGAAKTETVQALRGAGALVTSTITSEAALLSGSPRREVAKTATGGLLRKLGKAGVLVIKDVTSILSANRDTRATVLAAMREVYDGYWERNLGTDGGRSIKWEGRLVVIGAVTSAWDNHHSVVATMGDRFVLLRFGDDGEEARMKAAAQAARNAGHEVEMREELAAAVGGVLVGVKAGGTNGEVEIVAGLMGSFDRLLRAANVVTRARTAVQRDYQGNVISSDLPEMPTRFTKQLIQILRGAMAVGMSFEEAERLALRCARDSIPPLRLAVLEDVAANPYSILADVRKRVDKPRNTVDRELQALHLLSMLTCEEVKVPTYSGVGESTRWHYSLTEGTDLSSFR